MAQLCVAPVRQPYQSHRVGRGGGADPAGSIVGFRCSAVDQERRRDRNSGSWGRFWAPPVWLQEPAGGSGINWHPEAEWSFWFSTDQGGGRRYAHIRERQRPFASSFTSLPLFCFVFCFSGYCSVTFPVQCSLGKALTAHSSSPELSVINISSTAQHFPSGTFFFLSLKH